MFNAIAQYVGISDIVDVLATSVLIYYLLVLIRGTRAVQILSGIIFLVALLGLANLLHLDLLGSILRVVLVGAAVTIPIVFQPELRRALEQIGRGGFFRLRGDDADSFRTRSEDGAIVTIARTAFFLSNHRIGALLVLEQQSGLKEFFESGKQVRATISEELLLAIFAPGSPLHDGAVIVREGQIEAAGCFLPLAEQSLMKGRIGTRHRAALGLTEQTDAVVVVVSEETGGITIARDGRLSRPVDDEQRLIRMLLAVTRPPRAQRRGSGDLISRLRSRVRLQSASATRRRPRIFNANDDLVS